MSANPSDNAKEAVVKAVSHLALCSTPSFEALTVIISRSFIGRRHGNGVRNRDVRVSASSVNQFIASLSCMTS